MRKRCSRWQLTNERNDWEYKVDMCHCVWRVFVGDDWLWLSLKTNHGWVCVCNMSLGYAGVQEWSLETVDGHEECQVETCHADRLWRWRIDVRLGQRSQDVRRIDHGGWHMRASTSKRTCLGRLCWLSHDDGWPCQATGWRTWW
jgi:hypothetical protein